jgi:hypothetical protein
MKKIIEKIKLFWTNKVVPAFKLIVTMWKKIVEIATSKEFVYFFPLAVFGVSALLCSHIFLLVFLIWLIPTIHEIAKGE